MSKAPIILNYKYTSFSSTEFTFLAAQVRTTQGAKTFECFSWLNQNKKIFAFLQKVIPVTKRDYGFEYYSDFNLQFYESMNYPSE